MKKYGIDIQKLLAGALLIFDRFDNLDLDILNEFLIKEKDSFVVGEDIGYIDKLIDFEDGIVFLKKEYTLDSELEDSTLREKLIDITGSDIASFFENIDMEIFTLKKLQKVGNIPLEDAGSFLNGKQQDTLDKILDDYSITLVWNGEHIQGDYLEIVLTSYGMQRIFEHDNKEEVEQFKEKLRRQGLNHKVIGEFLRAQDLEQPAKQILTVSNFNKFYKKYGEFLEEDSKPYVKKHK